MSADSNAPTADWNMDHPQWTRATVCGQLSGQLVPGQETLITLFLVRGAVLPVLRDLQTHRPNVDVLVASRYSLSSHHCHP